jgi:predicted amidophosphoribosyltransferase
VEGISVAYAFHHSGTGRLLVHRLKYHGLTSAAELLAGAMAPLIPLHTSALVPVPRAAVRRIGYGVDPAWELARRLGRRLHVPVVSALRAPLWWSPHAKAGSRSREAPRFAPRRPVRGPIVLIDDVVTSGATLAGAVAALDIEIMAAVAATSPGMMVSSKALIASRRLRDGQARRQRSIEVRP